MRCRLALILLAMLVVVVELPAAETLPIDLSKRRGSDWPTFLGPTGDSISPEKGIKPWPAKGLRIVWQRKLATGYGIGSISRGRYFQFERQGDEARLVCLEAETGRELWQRQYPCEYEDLYGYNNGPRTSPVVDGDRVYTYGVEGLLRCYNVAEGELIWSVDVNRKFGVIQNFFGVGSTPVIHGDLILALVGGSPPEDAEIAPGQLDRVSGNGSGIVAFDKRTGVVKYQITDELASYSTPKLASIAGRDWCFAFCRGGLVGFEPATGKVDFQFPWRDRQLESVNAATPVVAGDKVLISETYGVGSAVLKVRPGNCEVVWKDDPRKRDQSLQCHWNTPIHVDGYVYGSSGRHTENAELRCIELATGKVMWSVPDLTRSSLLYIDGHFIGLNEYGRLFLFKANPQRFELVSALVLREAAPGNIEPLFPGEPRPPLLKYPAWAAPIVARGLMYVRGDDRLVCLDLLPEAAAAR